MTKDSINQIFDRARHGDVFAQVLMGQILIDGKYVPKDIQSGIGWMNNAARCNCLYAQDYLNDMKNNLMTEANQQKSEANAVEPNRMDYGAELSNLVGLAQVKQDIESLKNLIKVQVLRSQQGLPNTKVSYHCVFTGNPGTGKTTVARIVAGIYKELGLLKKGHFIEVDRSKLVGEYVGQTAPKTNKVIDEALDGVLFIDEAYTLVGGQNDYGSEAIATLLKRMEDDRDRLVVILAGYTDEIKEFINSNPWLQSSFNRYIHFEDYSADELLEIFMRNIKRSEYNIRGGAYVQLKINIHKAIANKDRNFGNARYVRNLFERIVQKQANRLSMIQHPTREQLKMITIEDI